jgi:hypothetical protein
MNSSAYEVELGCRGERDGRISSPLIPPGGGSALGRFEVFTAFYVLVGIGILVEVARQLGFAMIELRVQDRQAKAAAKAAKHPDEGD